MADLNSTIVRGKLRVTEDINANGNITGNGSGLTNLNASNISSGTLSADRLDTSGATAGSYGPSANATPAYGAKFNVPYITVDNKGRVTKAETKTITIPALGTSSTTAAAGDHNHDGRYLKWNGSAANVEAMGWGTLTANNGYTILSHASSGDGGDWGMVNKDGKIFMQLDGYYYQNEGQYRVLDTSDIDSSLSSTSANPVQNKVVKSALDGKVNSSDLVELTLTDNGTKRFLIGSGLATTWTDIGTNSKVYTQSGNLYASAFYAASDRRLKENIKDLDLNCLDLVNNINLREFSWKTDETHKPVIGAIAQELKQVLPEKYVHEFIGGEETEDEYLSVNDSKLVYLLIGAIQEQQEEIEELKRKIV